MTTRNTTAIKNKIKLHKKRHVQCASWPPVVTEWLVQYLNG